MNDQEREEIIYNKVENPRFSGKHHTEESKKKISDSMTKRHQAIRDYLNITDEKIERICQEVVEEYLKENRALIEDCSE